MFFLVGSPLVVVQVGRFDVGSDSKNTISKIIDWQNPSATTVNEAFDSSGLGPKEVTLYDDSLVY